MSVAVVLLNGYEIQPTTFATRPGIGGANSLSRVAIRDRILQWNAGVAAPDSIPGREGGDRRYSGLRRDDLVGADRAEPGRRDRGDRRHKIGSLVS